MIKKIVRNHTLAGALALAGSVLLASGMPVNAENSYVTDFGTGGPAGTDGWKSDDTRNAAGVNLIGGADFANPGYTHAPGADTVGNNIYSPTGVAAQIDWQNLYGSRGNLGSLNLTANVNGSTAFTVPQKSTISVINSTSGLGVAAAALGEDFSATYRFNKGPNNDPLMGGGVALKIGVQSAAWGESQTDFAAPRSGESSWDLLLVHDPSYDGVNYGTSTFYTETVSYTEGKWKLFGQATNSYWSTAESGVPPGNNAPAKTLAEWASDPVWGPLLFGADGVDTKIADVQFGVGSGNAGMDAGLDWAQVSFLNDGGTIDFVDASTWTGNAGDNEFKTATNWTTNGMLQGPSADNNVVFTGSGTTTANVSTNTDARSIAAGSGTVNLVVAPSTTLALKNNGFLSGEKGATLNLSGGTGSLVTAAAVEAWGNVNIATKVTLDGGSVNQPVRNGRYAIVVAEGGELTLKNGADVTVGNASGAQGVKTLIRVGEMTAEGGVGVMNIEEGAHLTAGSTVGTANWTGFHIGDWGGEGVVNQTGGIVDLFGGLVIGNEAAGTTSDLGSKGTYNLSGGALNIYRPAGDNGAIIVGRATADRYAEGILNVSGGLLDLGAVGGASGNVALVVGGLSDNVAAYANAKGTVNQTGGIVRFTNGKLIFGRGQGTYNLNGGTLEIGGTNGISATSGGTPTFNFGGGTLKVINSNLTTSINANVVANKRSYIDTNGFDATWGGNFVSAGLHQIDLGGSYLEKKGDGRLTLSGASRVLDTFAVTDGEVRQTAGATSAVEFMVGSGQGSTASYLMDGGTFQVNPSTRVSNGDAVSGSFRVGDFNGTGAFVQTAGTVSFANNSAMIIGNRGGKGTYGISGGDVQLAENSLNVLGRNDPQDGNPLNPGFAKDLGSSEGTLNISGTGLVEVGGNGTTGGSLILSSNQNTVNLAIGRASKGTIHQTGGRLVVHNGASLYLGAAGTGVYNLNGGTLEIGGNSLQGVYGNLGGTYDFNLGGGTIKVIESDLVTSVNADLTPGTVSTIDTGALNATWGGNLIGEGLHQVDFGGSALVKAGTGRLTFTGNTRTLDTFAVTAGQVRQTIGATSAVEMMVGTGAGSIGTYLMDGGTLQINPSTKKADGSAVSGSFRVGDFNGTGTFTQTAGAVTLAPNSALVIGNRGGKGTYDISGGTLQLSNTLNVLGRNDPKDGTTNPSWAEDLGPSEGTLAISGNALVEVLTGGSLVLSSNSNTTIPGIGRASKGTINQTGGTLRINNGASLFLGAAGDGEYNLDGGVLEIGGNSLKGVYNNIGGSYVFNLGGGTIKTIGSKLVTDVDANLVAGSTSIIDTNNLGVDWSGDLTAAGLHQIDHGGSKLIKEGDGILAFTGTGLRKLDTFAVEGGGVRQAAGTTSAVELMVGTDPGNEGTYLMEAGNLNITAATDGSGNPVSGSFRVGDWGGEGLFTQTGGNVILGSNSALNIGNRGGKGTYDISGGKLELTSINVMGRNTTSDLIASEGVLNISGDALVDMLTGSSWILSSNAPTNNPAIATASKGTINQSGGTLRFNSGSNLYLGAYGTGAYNLTGGTLEIGGTSLNGIYNNRGGSYSFKFGGGTLKVIGSDLNASIDASISNNGLPAGATSYIDTNGFNATWGGNLSAAGLRQLDNGGSKLVKTGDGNLKFTGLSRVLDTFAVEGGSAQQTAGETTAVEFMVGTGAGKTGSYLMDDGILRIKPSVNASGDAVSGTFRVGDFGGTGAFTQTGGEVILDSNSALNIGNRAGSGTYEISGGSLTLSDSINVIGRNTGNDGVASTGVLKIDGTGLVEVQSGGSVILSSNETTTTATVAQASTGKIDQTGGTFRVNDGADLYLGAHGAGTYDLTGGTLEIGGDSLNGVYNNVGGSYAFNLDGGKIKVIGSDLNTDVNATLKTAGKTSTIDTNGFDATFTGMISGPGNLTKVGGGELTVVQEASIGTLMVSAGSAAFLSNLAAGDVELNGGDLDLKGESNTATGNVTVRDGSTLMGAIAADGDMVIEAGGTHQLCNESISNDAGAYLLKTDATLILDLDDTDLRTARLTLPTITLQDDSWIVLHSSEALNLFERIFLFNVGDLGLLTIGSSVNIQGVGAIAGYGFELGADGYVEITAVPEPSVMVLLALALGFVVIFQMKKRRQA